MGSIFLPYVLAGFILISLAAYIVFNKNMREYIACSKSMNVLFALILIVPLLYGNLLGFIVGIFIVLALLFFQFLRRVMTRELYERGLNLICILSVTSTVYAIVEKFIVTFIDSDYGRQRMSAMFFYPNYFGTIVATIIIICAYKILTNQGQKLFYISIALANVTSLYLSESMFAWIEVYIGIATLLIILKKYKLLSVWICAAVMAFVLIFVLDIGLIPRLSQANLTTKLRFGIWDDAIEQIKEYPLLGNGLMTYAYRTINNHQIIAHAHNIFLDMMMNFGVVGTVLISQIVFKFYNAVIKSCLKEKKTLINALILAVSAAALIHGITDITLFWIQTLPLFLFIVAGFGVYEKPEEEPAMEEEPYFYFNRSFVMRVYHRFLVNFLSGNIHRLNQKEVHK